MTEVTKNFIKKETALLRQPHFMDKNALFLYKYPY
jgi:hypothetical protein